MIQPLLASSVDALDELLASDGWRLLEDRFVELLKIEQRTLERDTPQDATNKARGAVAAYRIASSLPQNMRDEFAADLKA